MRQPSRSSDKNETNDDAIQPHPWLLKHYQEKRERTARLVKATVDHLVKTGQTVTIEAICRLSPEFDSEGKGVKKSSVLENPVAHTYYREHSTSYQAAQGRKRRAAHARPVLHERPQIDSSRDVDRVRYRYLQQSKADLAERLLSIEQAYAQMQQQLTRLQFEMIEIQHQQEEEKQRPRKKVEREQLNGNTTEPR